MASSWCKGLTLYAPSLPRAGAFVSRETRGGARFFQINAALFDSLWGLRVHTPGVSGLPAPAPWEKGVSPPGASDFSHVRKVTKRTPGTPRSPIFCLIGLYQIWHCSATEFRPFSNLQFGGQRDFGCRPVKGKHVSRGAGRNVFLETHPREYPEDNRTSRNPAGDSKGGVAPFVSSRGWGT